MKFAPLLSAPLPWLTAVASLFRKNKKTKTEIKKIKRRSRFWPRKISFTSVGKRFIAILFFVGIAAINTGNNLLYIIVAICLSIIIISGILSESTFKKVAVERLIPKEIYKDIPAYITYKIKNHKWFFPSYSFNIDEEECINLNTIISYILKLDKKSAVKVRPKYTFTKRGLNELYGLRLSTRFPFGLLTKSKTLRKETTVLVLPNINKKINIKEFTVSHIGDNNISKKGFGTDIHSLREYVEGEDTKRIHWKLSAKKSKLIHMERNAEDSKSIIIKFDNYYTEGKENFEELVDKTASLSAHYHKIGFKVKLVTLNDSSIIIEDKDGLHKALKKLALIEMSEKKGIAQVTTRANEN